MKKTYLLSLHTGYVGATHEEKVEIETDDYTTEKDIEDYLMECGEDMIDNHISIGWKEIEE